MTAGIEITLRGVLNARRRALSLSLLLRNVITRNLQRFMYVYVCDFDLVSFSI